MQKPLYLLLSSVLVIKIFFKSCDGDHDLPESEALKNLIEQGVIVPCRQGEHPSEWSRFRKYEHRFMPGFNLMITGKCNYNCRHCFNSSDNADRMEKFELAI